MKLCYAVFAAAAIMVATAGTAGADPSTPWQPGPGGPIGGVQQVPSICATQPLACAMHYDINHGAWVLPGDDQ
jgi:hypothetical protein